jgi:hypothetical protein
MVMSLYPVTQKNPKLAANVVKMLDIGMGGQEQVSEGVAETLPMDDAVKVLRHYGADHFKTTSNELHFYKNGRPLSVDLIWGNEGERSVNLSQLNSATRQLKGQGVAEGLDEAVGGNYLYHATSPAGLNGILQSGYIGAQQTAQPATDAQTKLPSVAVTRDWNYASGSARSSKGVGQGAVIVLDRNSIESKYKTFGSSQSWMTKGLPNATADTPQMKKLAQQTKFKDANKNGKLDYDELPAGAGGAGLKQDYFRPKSGGEAEEAVVVPKGKLPLQGSMVGFWVDPNSELTKDPTIMNDPRRLDMVRPNQFVKATQQQGVAERMLPKSAFAGSNKNKLGPAAHAKGKQKGPIKRGQFVGGSAQESKQIPVNESVERIMTTLINKIIFNEAVQNNK